MSHLLYILLFVLHLWVEFSAVLEDNKRFMRSMQKKKKKDRIRPSHKPQAHTVVQA